MRMRVKDITGDVYESDELTAEYCEQELNMTLDEACARVQSIFEHFDALEYLSVEIDGKKKFFNPTNVVWCEILD